MAGAGQYADGALKDGQLSLPRDTVYLAEIPAHQGAFQDAGKAFNKAGHVDRAVDMFADLRLWDDAKRFAALSSTIDARELIRRQGEWSVEVSDWASAADMFVKGGEPAKATRTYAQLFAARLFYGHE